MRVIRVAVLSLVLFGAGLHGAAQAAAASPAGTSGEARVQDDGFGW